jgi:hypothetical protein
MDLIEQLVAVHKLLSDSSSWPILTARAASREGDDFLKGWAMGRTNADLMHVSDALGTLLYTVLGEAEAQRLLYGKGKDAEVA